MLCSFRSDVPRGCPRRPSQDVRLEQLARADQGQNVIHAVFDERGLGVTHQLLDKDAFDQPAPSVQ
jgi:alpha-D-ribose 1-methylphosphonate 5-triphosphate synthase subunit PhnI